jgi:alkanesulfonate monooxygenase SsuD/methylene tetrahydromethanopterin reductase-like flavin-dependent oxidoreductase (luciferase family)
MEFGTLIFTKPQRAISDTRLIEEHGFTHAWFADSQMIWGDVYACMALAAVNSSKIKLATGISVASNRIPPVTVHSIATINEIAPGRVILGFGTGHTGRRVMGLPPVKFADFREQVRVIRDLLKDGEALYNTEGLSRKIRYLHRDLRFINLDDAIPFYVAANGPRTLGVAGEFADGIITTGVATPERLQAVFRHAEEGARKAGRDLPRRLPCVSLTQVMVIKPGEAIDSPRVMQMVGPWVITCLHAIAAARRAQGLRRLCRLHRASAGASAGALSRTAQRALHVRTGTRAALRDCGDDSCDDADWHARAGDRATPGARARGPRPDHS